MPTERVQRQIDSLLDEADAAVRRSEWSKVRDLSLNVLAFDRENADAKAYLEAAEFRLGQQGATEDTNERPKPPSSFANGRYQVKQFLGEGGKKRVYLAHDTLLDRDVAFALIKTEGLDAEGRERITREAQAMGKMGTHPHIVSVFDMARKANNRISSRS